MNRSPWSNQYFPPCEDAIYPSDRIRKLEETANFLFEKYKELYIYQFSLTCSYNNSGVSSVYLWESDNHICGCFLILNGIYSYSSCNH